MNTLAKTKGAATHARTRRSGSVSDWRTSFPRTIFVVQRKSFILKLKFSTKYLFGCKNYCEFRRFFLPQKSLKMRDVLEKMRECGKLPNLRDFPHDCGMVDTYALCGFDSFDFAFRPTYPLNGSSYRCHGSTLRVCVNCVCLLLRFLSRENSKVLLFLLLLE